MKLPTTQRLGLSDVEVALRHLVRLPELFALASTTLTAEMLDRPGEEELSMIWAACLQVARECGGTLPEDPYVSWQRVGLVLQRRLEQEPFDNPVLLEERLFADDTGILATVFDPVAPVDRIWGRGLLMSLLQERQVQDRLVQAVKASDYHQKIANLPAFLRDLQAAHLRIDAMASSPVRSSAPRDYRPADLAIDSTGLDFLDTAFGGGDAPKEVYGILGAFGSGKTLLAVQAALAKARQYQLQHFTYGQPLRHVYLFHYEAAYDEILRRVWCCAARIKAENLQTVDECRLSRAGDPLQPYEQQVMANEIRAVGEENVPREWERLQMAKEEIAQNLWLCDFSGPDDNPQRGTGYVHEIAAALEQERQNGREIGSVYIDYAGIACRRHISVLPRPRQDEMRHLVGEFGNWCRLLIAQPMSARVYVMHQLNSQANSRGFATRQHYSDAAEGRNFAENLHFCATLGTRDREFNCVQFDCSKARRSALLPTPPLLRMYGELGRFEVATDLTISPVLGRPVVRGEATAIQGGVAAALEIPQGTQRRSPYSPPDNANVMDMTEIE